MDKEILNALLEMVRSGGQMAVWGIVAYCGMQLLTVAVKGGVLCLVFRIISQTIKHCWDNYQRNKVNRVALISKEASDNILSAFKDYQDTVNQILKDIAIQLTSLSERLKDSQIKSS